MNCARIRSPKRNIEEVATGSEEPSAYNRKIEEERLNKRKAEEGSLDQEEDEGRIKSRNIEEKDQREKRKREEEENKGKLQKTGGETRGSVDRTLDIDLMGEEEFQERKHDLRENKNSLGHNQRNKLEKSSTNRRDPGHRRRILHMGDAEGHEQHRHPEENE